MGYSQIPSLPRFSLGVKIVADTSILNETLILVMSVEVPQRQTSHLLRSHLITIYVVNSSTFVPWGCICHVHVLSALLEGNTAHFCYLSHLLETHWFPSSSHLESSAAGSCTSKTCARDGDLHWVCKTGSCFTILYMADNLVNKKCLKWIIVKYRNFM